MKRDAVIIGAVCVVAIVFAVWFFLTEQPRTVVVEPKAVSIEVITTGTNARITEAKNYRIKNAEELREVWYRALGPEAPAVPVIDFSTHHVLAVFAGEKPTGGYDVGVQSVVDTETAREVFVVRVEPGESCMNTQALTSPYQFVAVPKSELPIVRTDMQVVSSCE